MKAFKIRFAILPAFLCSSWGASQPLNLRQLASLNVPLEEVSGLVAVLTPDGDTKIVTIGDHSPFVVELLIKKGAKPQINDFSESLLQRFSICKAHRSGRCAKIRQLLTDDWESIAMDASGQAYILQEFSSSVVILDSGFLRVDGRITLDLKKLKKKVAEDSGGEGLVLLKKGHLLISLEKKPTRLVEFGPPGDSALGFNKKSILAELDIFPVADDTTLVPLAEWSFASAGCDVSDLAVSQKGELFALSDTCRTISLMKDFEPGEQVVKVSKVWQLPGAISKPEALSIDNLGNFFVGCDTNKSTDHNIFIFGR